MARIFVDIGPAVAPGQVALFEMHPDHPTANGEIFIHSGRKGPWEVELTPAVADAIKHDRLVKTDAPKGKAGKGKADAKAEPEADAVTEGEEGGDA